MGFETLSEKVLFIFWKWFEVSLWDLKPRIRAKYTRWISFEVSLWDLKHQVEENFENESFYLKYPYGIWNAEIVEIFSISFWIWSIPMGFETS